MEDGADQIRLGVVEREFKYIEANFVNILAGRGGSSWGKIRFCL